jgi:uncharacterized protein YwgA
MAGPKTTKDILMLLLYAPGKNGVIGDPVNGQTRIMKMIFLFGKEVKKQFKKDESLGDLKLPDFTAYDYGPYSSDVYSSLEFLVNMGFVKVESAEEKSGNTHEEEQYWSAVQESNEINSKFSNPNVFTLTEDGKEFMKEALERWKVTDNQLQIISEFKTKCQKTPLKALLNYVYTKYPETTANSKIKEKVLGS